MNTVCHHFLRNKCYRGEFCRYLHPEGANERGPRFSRGSHDRAPCRWFLQGRCHWGDSCRHWHPSDGADASRAEPEAQSGGPRTSEEIMLETAALLVSEIEKAMEEKTPAELKQMRRALVSLWHPDKHVGKTNMTVLATAITQFLIKPCWWPAR